MTYASALPQGFNLEFGGLYTAFCPVCWEDVRVAISAVSNQGTLQAVTFNGCYWYLCLKDSSNPHYFYSQTLEIK